MFLRGRYEGLEPARPHLKWKLFSQVPPSYLTRSSRFESLEYVGTDVFLQDVYFGGGTLPTRKGVEKGHLAGGPRPYKKLLVCHAKK